MGLYQTHWNEITKLVSITLVNITSVIWVHLVTGSYLSKKNVVITFWSYVGIKSEKYVKLTLGSYVKKSYK